MPGYIGIQKKGLLIINQKEIYFKPDVVAPTCNLRIWEVEAGGSGVKNLASGYIVTLRLTRAI